MKINQVITAPVVFDGLGNAKKDWAIIIAENGEILDFLSVDQLPFDLLKVMRHYDGALCPGFVNAHCHLELSHMKGLVDTGTTLIPFIKSVVQQRGFPIETVLNAITEGDQEMQNNGIVAVGDISNKVDTAATKVNSPIQYYTFIEMFDLMEPSQTLETIAMYEDVYQNQTGGGKNKKSYVPHAPYSVTSGLFEYINQANDPHATISIHNQETEAENKFFESKKGPFLEFYNGFGNELSHFEATGQRSIHHTLKHLKHSGHTLMVHNTTTNASDIQAAHDWSSNVYWVTCPNANLYIENTLPKYDIFLSNRAKMCIGTDSLTSNWKLSIASEIMSIQKYCSYVVLEDLIMWATNNGAKALGFSNLGSIEKGKKPGINQIDVNHTNGKWRMASEAVHKIL